MRAKNGISADFQLPGSTYVAGSVLRYVQTGDVQSYAAVMAVALLAGVVYALWVFK